MSGDLTKAKNSSAASSGTNTRCFTVKIEGRNYGLPVEAIQTVFEMTSVTPVPLAPKEILGLVNLRGKIATAVSLRRRLQPDSIERPSTLAVGIEHRGESFALVVDEVGDVITLNHGSEIDAPRHIEAETPKFTSVHRLESQILPILDLNWALTFDTREETASGLSTRFESES